MSAEEIKRYSVTIELAGKFMNISHPKVDPDVEPEVFQVNMGSDSSAQDMAQAIIRLSQTAPAPGPVEQVIGRVTEDDGPARPKTLLDMLGMGDFADLGHAVKTEFANNPDLQQKGKSLIGFLEDLSTGKKKSDG